MSGAADWFVALCGRSSAWHNRRKTYRPCHFHGLLRCAAQIHCPELLLPFSIGKTASHLLFILFCAETAEEPREHRTFIAVGAHEDVHIVVLPPTGGCAKGMPL